METLLERRHARLEKEDDLMIGGNKKVKAGEKAWSSKNSWM